MRNRSFNLSWYLVLGLVSMASLSKAQDVKVTAKLDNSAIPLGDQTNLRLSVHLPLKAQVTFPVLADTLSAKIQLVGPAKMDTIADPKDPAFITITQTYVLTSFDAGLHAIPAFTFKSGAEEIKSSPIPLEVTAVKIDTTKSIYDIKQPLAVRYTWIDWLRDHWAWVLFPLIGLIALIVLIYYLRRRKPVKAVPVEVKPLVPAHVLALDKLKALQAKKLWQQDQVKAYHSELSDIMREYLERRYELNAMEQTSDEILHGLRHRDLPDASRNDLRQILILADLVKFAKEKPLNTENEQSMEKALSFVSKTQENKSLPDSKVQKNNNESA